MKNKNPQSRRRLRRNRREKIRRERAEERERRYLREAARFLDDPREYPMCLKKTRYDDQGDALAAANRSLLRGAPQLRIYLCPFCQGWHITSKAEYEPDAEDQRMARSFSG